jgi:hypothetical protein
MTVAAGTAVRRYDGNDVAVDFAFPEIFYNNSDLVIYHSDVNGVITNPVLDTDYTVTGVGTATSGSVEFPKGGSSYLTLATGEQLTISRESTKSRTTDMDDALFFDDMNLGEDKTMTMVQENALGVDRSIRRNIVDLDSINMELPIASERAGTSILFNADGSVGVGAVASNTITSGAGAPVVAPTNKGDIYIDNTYKIIYMASDNSAVTDWMPMNKQWLIWDMFGATQDCATGSGELVEEEIGFDGIFLQSDDFPQWLMANNETAGITGTMVIDILKNSTTIMATNKIDIESTKKTSTDAASTQPDLTVTTFTRTDIIKPTVLAIHSGTVAKGLRVKALVLERAETP